MTSAAVAGCLLPPLVSKAVNASRAVRGMSGKTSRQSVMDEERRERRTGEKRRSRSLFKVTKVPSFVCTCRPPALPVRLAKASCRTTACPSMSHSVDVIECVLMQRTPTVN